MKRTFTSLFIFLLLLSSCSTQANDHLPERNEPSRKMKEEIPVDFFPQVYKIVAIGDSLTQGVGDSTKRGGYIPYLQEYLEAEKGIKEAVFSNFGVRGRRTSQLIGQLKEQEVYEAVREADMVIITTGGNDLMKVVKENFIGLMLEDFVQDKKEYEKNFKNLIRTLREINEDVMICVIGLYNPYYEFFSHIEEIDLIIAEWNKMSRQILEQYPNTYFVDISHIFQENGEDLLYAKDYFHPNDKGYQVIAKQVYSVLNEQALKVLGNSKFASSREEQAEHE